MQKKYLNTEYTFIKDFILLICIYFFYINARETPLIMIFIKYFFIIIFIRFVLANLTSIKEINNGVISDKKHFQISTRLVIFTLLVLIAFDNNLISQPILIYSIICYGILNNIISESHSTFELIVSILITHFVYNNLKQFI